MTAKTARVYTLDELKEKSQQALCYRRLREIVQTAPLNNDGKINLSWVDREAEKYIHEENEQIGDLQTIEKLRKSTRALAMLRRQSAEEFEKLVGKRNIDYHQFRLPHFADLTTKEFANSGREIFITFTENEKALNFAKNILDALVETYPSKLRYELFGYIEKKFGLKVKVCGNCENYKENRDNYPHEGSCYNSYPDENVPIPKYGRAVYFSDNCRKWTPEGVPETKEN